MSFLGPAGHVGPARSPDVVLCVQISLVALKCNSFRQHVASAINMLLIMLQKVVGTIQQIDLTYFSKCAN